MIPSATPERGGRLLGAVAECRAVVIERGQLGLQRGLLLQVGELAIVALVALLAERLQLVHQRLRFARAPSRSAAGRRAARAAAATAPPPAPTRRRPVRARRCAALRRRGDGPRRAAHRRSPSPPRARADGRGGRSAGRPSCRCAAARGGRRSARRDGAGPRRRRQRGARVEDVWRHRRAALDRHQPGGPRGGDRRAGVRRSSRSARAGGAGGRRGGVGYAPGWRSRLAAPARPGAAGTVPTTSPPDRHARRQALVAGQVQPGRLAGWRGRRLPVGQRQRWRGPDPCTSSRSASGTGRPAPARRCGRRTRGC